MALGVEDVIEGLEVFRDGRWVDATSFHGSVKNVLKFNGENAIARWGRVDRSEWRIRERRGVKTYVNITYLFIDLRRGRESVEKEIVILFGVVNTSLFDWEVTEGRF